MKHITRTLAVCCTVLAASTSWTPAAESLADLFDRVNPTVVEIGVQGKQVAPGLAGPVSVQGLGSGVLIDKSGLILTAAHVVQTAEKVGVKFLHGEVLAAQVLGSVPSADVALIQLMRMPKEVHIAEIADSDDVKVGEQVFVIGAPLGVSHTLTVGHVSARRAPNSIAGGLADTELLQTDAAINPGNSGGPLFNMKGQVIGVVSHIISQSGGAEGLGFAISANTARRLLLEQRSLWSGFEGFVLTPELAGLFNVPQKGGVLVQNVADDSPGSRLGLRGGQLQVELDGQPLVVGGDIILSVNDISLADSDARERIRSSMTGLKDLDKISLTVLRGGEVVRLEEYFMIVHRPPEPVANN